MHNLNLSISPVLSFGAPVDWALLLCFVGSSLGAGWLIMTELVRR